MIGMIPVIVVGGVVKHFSTAFFGKSNGTGKRKKPRTKKSAYPSGEHRPF